MKQKISRRDFLRKSGTGFGILSITGFSEKDTSLPRKVIDKMPKQKIGRTGQMVSRIGFGGGSRFCDWIPEEKMAERILDYAIKLDINYFDTSIKYGKDYLSEKRFGKYLVPKYRDKIFLISKSDQRTYDGVMDDFSITLKNLDTDYLDLYHMHGIEDMDDVETLSGANGGFKAFRRLRDEGVIANIGFSFHVKWSNVIKEAIKRFKPDVIMCPLNAARDNGCEEYLLPIAKGKNIDVVAMKVTAKNKLIGNVTGQDLLRYTLSLPVSVVNVGIDGFGTLESCIQISKEPLLLPQEREKIRKKLSYDPNIHKIPYLQPGYIDGFIHA